MELVVWREERTESGFLISNLVLDHNYFENLPTQTRAAIGYISTFVGNECKPDINGENVDIPLLSCTLLSALKLGKQCSEKHLGYLEKMFAGDSIVLERLSKCVAIPAGGTHQTTFNKIYVRDTEETIDIVFEAVFVNVRKDVSQEWVQFLKFKKSEETLQLTSNKRIDL